MGRQERIVKVCIPPLNPSTFSPTPLQPISFSTFSSLFLPLPKVRIVLRRQSGSVLVGTVALNLIAVTAYLGKGRMVRVKNLMVFPEC